MRTFKVGSVIMEYNRTRGYNGPLINERTIEVPLGEWFLDKIQAGNTVEVGCVMPHYRRTSHDVIDLFEKDGLSRPVDARTFDFTGKHVLCISTLEHVGCVEGTDVPTKETMEDAITLLGNMTATCGKFLITIPMASHPALESFIRDVGTPGKDYFVMYRYGGSDNAWAKVLTQDTQNTFTAAWRNCAGHRLYVCVLTNMEELLNERD